MPNRCTVCDTEYSRNVKLRRVHEGSSRVCEVCVGDYRLRCRNPVCADLGQFSSWELSQLQPGFDHSDLGAFRFCSYCVALPAYPCASCRNIFINLLRPTEHLRYLPKDCILPVGRAYLCGSCAAVCSQCETVTKWASCPVCNQYCCPRCPPCCPNLPTDQPRSPAYSNWSPPIPSDSSASRWHPDGPSYGPRSSRGSFASARTSARRDRGERRPHRSRSPVGGRRRRGRRRRGWTRSPVRSRDGVPGDPVEQSGGPHSNHGSRGPHSNHGSRGYYCANARATRSPDGAGPYSPTGVPDPLVRPSEGAEAGLSEVYSPSLSYSEPSDLYTRPFLDALTALEVSPLLAQSSGQFDFTDPANLASTQLDTSPGQRAAPALVGELDREIDPDRGPEGLSPKLVDPEGLRLLIGALDPPGGTASDPVPLGEETGSTGESSPRVERSEQIASPVSNLVYSPMLQPIASPVS